MKFKVILVKKWLISLLVLVLGIPVHADEPDELYAQSAVLMDAENGRVLFEKNGLDVKAMASTTKIMTCILALENADEKTEVLFSENAVRQPKVHLGASKGEIFYLVDLLHSLMLESHNDSAVAIAEAVAGDVKKFADMMNQKAREIGCENTYFITPNGLDAEDENGKHSTTAVDLARIMSYCIMDSPMKDSFLEITATPQYSFSSVDGKKTYSCSNHNSFLNMMDEAISGKTGFTADAGYCYVGAVESEGRTFVVSLLACGWPNSKTYKWKDMKKLASYGMDNYAYTKIDELPLLDDILVKDGIPETGNLFEQAKVSVRVEKKEKPISVLMKQSEQIEVRVQHEDRISAPVSRGTKVGQVTYLLNDVVIANYPIVVAKDVSKKNFAWTFSEVLEMYALQ